MCEHHRYLMIVFFLYVVRVCVQCFSFFSRFSVRLSSAKCSATAPASSVLETVFISKARLCTRVWRPRNKLGGARIAFYFFFSLLLFALVTQADARAHTQSVNLQSF